MFEGSEAFRISALDYGIYYFLHGHGHLVSFVTFIALCATFFLRNTYHCMVLKLQVDLGFFLSSTASWRRAQLSSKHGCGYRRACHG